MTELEVSLSADEIALLRQVATTRGISEVEAASLLMSAAIARRVKKRTGKTPAKVYQIKPK